jgi:hypothetical protein
METEAAKPHESKKRDWFQIVQGFTAIAALIFAGVTLYYTGNGFNDSHQQLQLNEQGQVTDWYSAAITDLGSSSIDARVGGIYLQLPTVVSIDWSHPSHGGQTSTRITAGRLARGAAGRRLGVLAGAVRARLGLPAHCDQARRCRRSSQYRAEP